MIVYTVSQLLEMSDGTVPEAFRGKIKSVMKPFASKEGDPKPWKLQKLVITDGAKEIECILDNRAEDVPRTMEGSQIYAVAYRGDRGINGLKRKVNAKKNNAPQVWIYDGADVSFEGAGGGTQPPAQQNQPPAQQSNTPPATNGHTNGNGNGNGPSKANSNGNQPPAGGIADKRTLRANEMKSFDKRIARTAAALNRCFDASINLIADVNKRHDNVLGKPSAELVEKIAMGLMVNACWTQKPAELEHFPMKAFQLVDEEDAKFNSQSNTQQPAEGAGARREGVPFN